jgi:hypothetical protein
MESENMFDTMNPQETDGQLRPGQAGIQAESLDSDEEEDREESPRRARPRTILLAVGVGLVATVCMVVFLVSDRLNSFDGADRVAELLDAANNLTGDEFEAVETKADQEVLFYMFPSDDLGIKVPSGKWEIVEDERWVGGITGVNDICFLVAFKGRKPDMEEFLANLSK